MKIVPKFKFRSIEQALKFTKDLEKSSPYTKEKLERDLELSKERNYNIQSEVKSKGALTFLVPDLSVLFGTMMVEAGISTVEGFGRTKIPFESSFSETPGLVYASFGFVELTVPWVAIEWRSFSVGWWSIRLPVPKLEEMTIRLPTLCFLMNVDKDGFEVFNVAGRTNLAYLAIGR